MSEHRVEYTHSLKRVGEELSAKSHWAQCKCGANSGWKTTREQCEDWAGVHQRSIQTVLAALGRSTPSVDKMLKFYRERSVAPDVSTADRALWKQLADELAPRCSNNTSATEESPLF